MRDLDHFKAAQARDMDPHTIATWIERGYLRADLADNGHHLVDGDELDRVIAWRCAPKDGAK